jgi:hypothetical protein
MRVYPCVSVFQIVSAMSVDATVTAYFVDAFVLWIPEGLPADAPLPSLSSLSATASTAMLGMYVLRPYFLAVSTSSTASASVLNASTSLVVANWALPSSASVCFPEPSFFPLPLTASSCSSLWSASVGADLVNAVRVSSGTLPRGASAYLGLSGPVEFGPDGLRLWSTFSIFQLSGCSGSTTDASFGCQSIFVGQINRAHSASSAWYASNISTAAVWPSTRSWAMTSLRMAWPWSGVPTASVYQLGVVWEKNDFNAPSVNSVRVAVSLINKYNWMGGADTFYMYPVTDGCDGANAAAVYSSLMTNLPNLTAVVSSTCSGSAIAVTNMLANIRVPYVSASSTSGVLSSSATFPYFIRVVAGDAYQVC